MLCAQHILSRKIAFGKTEVMYGIQQVGFSLSITSANTYNPFAELELLVKIIFELEKWYGMQLQAQCKILELQRLHFFSNTKGDVAMKKVKRLFFLLNYLQKKGIGEKWLLKESNVIAWRFL